MWRSLVIVPLPRVQSVKVSQGPLERALRLASVHVQTVQGPVTARVGALDARDAQRLWSDTAGRAVEAAAADTSHRWREREARSGSAGIATDQQAVADTAAATATPTAVPGASDATPSGPQGAHRAAPEPPGPWGETPPPGAAR
ncbi:PH domain-containing protein [Curtobacterium flaccumfaciens]|nr:PH domain-containing protein [Curtobacterium flaccumfaciens]